MTYNPTNIRTAIIETIEAAGSFSYGAFTGMPDDALGAKTVQTSTAQHWFDVVLTPSRANASSNVVAGMRRRLIAIDIRIPVWSRLPTPVQESSRSSVVEDVAAECGTVARALAAPGALAETDAGSATGLVSGCMLGSDGRGTPDWMYMREDWERRVLRSEIRGSVTVRSTSSYVLAMDGVPLTFDGDYLVMTPA